MMLILVVILFLAAFGEFFVTTAFVAFFQIHGWREDIVLELFVGCLLGLCFAHGFIVLLTVARFHRLLRCHGGSKGFSVMTAFIAFYKAMLVKRILLTAFIGFSAMTAFIAFCKAVSIARIW